jgi:cyclopropane-fatty-acyl-phospholipid synthase
MWLLDQMLRRLIRKGRLIVIDHDGKEYAYGPGTDAPLRIRLTDKGASTHIARYPRVGAGEAYMDGRMVIEPPHDIRDLVLFVALNAEGDHERALGAKGPAQAAGPGRRHGRQLQRPALGPQERRIYLQPHPPALRTVPRRGPAIHHGLLPRSGDQPGTGAARQEGAHRGQAQSRPRHLFGQARARHRLRLGGLALYLHRHYDVDVLGVALAPDQIEFCRERAAELGVADRVKFELMDYRDVQGEFDRITSVGLLEHVGTPQYPAFFEHTHRLLKPDGVMFSHCCGRAGLPAPPMPGRASTSSPAATSPRCPNW